MKKILITGGAGYIGSHLSELLLRNGYSVRILDNFSSGLHSRVDGFFEDIRELDLLQRDLLADSLADIDFVIHLAAKKSVDESMNQPLKYYENNIGGTINLLAAMVQNQVKGIVFSSSAAVYSPTNKQSIYETDETLPISVYGATKLLGEEIISKVSRANDFSSISLRYFNVVGCSRREFADHSQSNLFPKILSAIKAERNPEIYGSDYDTRDGTCVRDFIHVTDLAQAHLAALQKLESYKIHEVYNVGTGKGFTVKEVLEVFSKVTKTRINPSYLPRRIGDSPNAVAATHKIEKDLGWSATFGLEQMVSSVCNLEIDL